MGKYTELPLLEPLYSTYHYQGAATATIVKNKRIRNYYLNEVMNLTCDRRFLNGFTTPELTIPNSSWTECPHLNKHWCSSQYTKGYTNAIIRAMLDDGVYVAYVGADDYYLEGKTWYKERHFKHDGLICGYNQDDNTFCIYAYDNKWIYRKFWVSQKSFNKARLSMMKRGTTLQICGLSVKGVCISISPETIKLKIKEYLDSNIEKYPYDGEGKVYGIVVQEYIAKYVDKLYDGSIPYENADRRVFRVLWEHKKAMLERIRALEREVKIDKCYGDEYESIVSEANIMRLLYAGHNMRRRDSVLPLIREKLHILSNNEKKILTSLIDALEEVTG